MILLKSTEHVQVLDNHLFEFRFTKYSDINTQRRWSGICTLDIGAPGGKNVLPSLGAQMIEWLLQLRLRLQLIPIVMIVKQSPNLFECWAMYILCAVGDYGVDPCVFDEGVYQTSTYFHQRY